MIYSHLNWHTVDGSEILQHLGCTILPVNNVGIPGKHDLRLAGEKAIDFQRWPLEATDFGVSMVWIFVVLEWWWFLERVMVIFEFYISKHGTPETLDAVKLFAFFSHGFAESYLRFAQTTEIEWKAIAAHSASLIHLLGHSSMIFLHSSHPFIFLVQPKRLEVFWKHKQKRKDVIPIVVEPGNARQTWGRCFMGCFVGTNHHQIMSFNRRNPWVWHGWFVFFQMHGVGTISTDSIFMPAGFMLLIYEAALYWGFFTETKLSFPPLKDSPLNSDCCEKRALFVGGVQSVVHISLDVLKTPDKAGRLFFVYQLKAADWPTTSEIYDHLDLRSICQLPMLPWIVGI